MLTADTMARTGADEDAIIRHGHSDRAGESLDGCVQLSFIGPTGIPFHISVSIPQPNEEGGEDERDDNPASQFSAFAFASVRFHLRFAA